MRTCTATTTAGSQSWMMGPSLAALIHIRSRRSTERFGQLYHSIEFMRPLCRDDIVAPETSAFAALMQMRRTGRSRLMVLHGGALFGIVTSRDLLDVLSLERELHQYKSGATGLLVPR